jgi:hypothetical protein
MEILALADLVDRWTYTRVGIHKLSKRDDFPKPVAVAVVNRGRTKIFLVSDIAAYERDKPWLLDENQKSQRQRLFCLLQLMKELPDGQEKQQLLEKLFGRKAVMASHD